MENGGLDQTTIKAWTSSCCRLRWFRDHDGSDQTTLPGVGLQFIRISDEARVAIDRFVATREPMFMPE